MIPKNREMRFEVTTHCNYNCEFCNHHKLSRKREVMDINLFKLLFSKIVTESPQYDSVSFAGIGEPLMDSTLEDKIKYIKKTNPKYMIPIVTNGSLLTKERFLSLQEAGVDSIRVSFHGGTAASYALTHGVKGYFNLIRDRVLSLINLPDRTTRITVALVIGKHNEYTIDHWKDIWEKSGADLIEIWRAHNWNSSFDYREKQEKRLNTCGRVFSGPLQIQVDGTINACCFDYDGKLIIGDLKEQGLAEIFDSDKYKEISKCHITGHFEDTDLICKNCDQRNSDNSQAIIYSSAYKDLKDRVNRVSTTHYKLEKEAQ